MNLLAIDTSTDLATVAVAAGNNLYHEEQSNMRQHALVLLPMIERLLHAAHLTVGQLDGIVLGQGPGSFTGLRIACSVAKGLAYAHDLPIYAISGLTAIANEAYEEMGELLPSGTQILALLDARMHQVYWACYDSLFTATVEQVSSPQDILLPNAPILLAGVGFEPYIGDLLPSLQKNIVKQAVIYPKATALLRLAQSGQFAPLSAQEALPVYVRNQITQGERRG